MELARKVKNQNMPIITYLGTATTVCFLLLYLVGTHVDGGHISSLEKNLFLALNGLPEFLKLPMTVFQYAGLLFAPLAAAVLLAVYKKYIPAILVLLVIPIKLQSEIIIKAHYLRERPKVYIPEAILRGDVQASGLSFTSGHAMIVFAIATFVTPYVPKTVRIVVWSIALLCITARVYLGAHLPLDVIGGALTGISAGCVLILIHKLIKSVVQSTLHKHSEIKIIEEPDISDPEHPGIES